MFYDFSFLNTTREQAVRWDILSWYSPKFSPGAYPHISLRVANSQVDVADPSSSTKILGLTTCFKDDFQSVLRSLSPQCLWASHEGMRIDVIR